MSEALAAMALDTDDIIKIMQAARAADLSEFELNGLKFKLRRKNAEIIIAGDNPVRRKEDLAEMAKEIKLNLAEELKLTDPEAYESLMAQGITGEKVPMPEVDPSATAPHEA